MIKEANSLGLTIRFEPITACPDQDRRRAAGPRPELPGSHGTVRSTEGHPHPGRPVLHGKDSGGCARAFTIPELGVQEIVKRDGDTDVDLGTRKPGTLRFTCAMGMQTGVIEFKKDL
ncbi:cupredoxin domain-containing protein [Streptomyces sp. NBC_00190]|uniref:hypothetical protein n=1 Tax=unclassified Streptomyces TaxID=2593676 RepID=UPI002E27D617|nr:hypothetical protein [Streptomyces sp. NBC_00190]WSZ38034.1 cupredoxin domain-containing protein [Streptomyces sp. NBC_00868]